MYSIELLLIIIYYKVGTFGFELFLPSPLLPLHNFYNSSPLAIGNKTEWRVDDTLIYFVLTAFYHCAEDFFTTEQFSIMS